MSDFYCDEALSGRTPVERVIETEDVLAFRHTRPHWREHVVVVPKRHVESLATVDEALLLEIFRVLREIAARFEADHGGAHGSPKRLPRAL